MLNLKKLLVGSCLLAWMPAMSAALPGFGLPVAPVEAGQTITRGGHRLVEAITPVSTGHQLRLGENSPLKPPFCETFDNFRTGLEHDDFARYFQVIDSNNDKRSWGLYNYAEAKPYGRSAYMLYPLEGGPADDWLVTRAIRLEKGKYYCISLDAALFHDDAVSPQVFEVKCGMYNDAEGLDETVIPRTEVTSTNFDHVHGWFKPEYDGLYYVGVHGISPLYQGYYNYLMIDNISVDAPRQGGVPAGVRDVVMTNDSNGTAKVEITFTAPDRDIAGNKLTTIDKITVYRGETVAKEFSNVAAGETMTFVDDPVDVDTYRYKFVPSNAEGVGEEEYVTHTVGLARPTSPVVTSFEDLGRGRVKLTWTAPTVDVNGNKINPDILTYTIYEEDENGQFKVADGVKGTEYEYIIGIGEGMQRLSMCMVSANMNAWESELAPTAYLCLGDAYTMPHYNSFTLRDYYEYVLEQRNDEGVIWRMLDDHSDPNAQDGDNGYVAMIGNSYNQRGCLMSGKIDLSGVTNPVLSFYTFVYDEDENDINIIVADVETGKEEVVANVQLKDFDRIGWRRVTVPINGYNDRVVRIGLEGHIVSHGYIPVDNLRLDEMAGVDLAVTLSDYPRNAALGQTMSFTAVVENFGTETTSDYTVSLLRDGKVVSTADGVAVESLKEVSVELFDKFGPDSEETASYRVVVDNADDRDPDNNLSDEVDVAFRAPLHPVVTNLQAVESDGGVTLTWNEPDVANAVPDETVEDFESYAPYATNVGDWTMVDVDGGYVGGFVGVPMKVDGTQQAFWVMNTTGNFSFIPTTSGTNAIVAMYSMNESLNMSVPSDDWLISPRLYGGRQTVTFNAASLREDYGLETIEVYYSTTGNDIDDFNLLMKNTEVPVDFTEFGINLPEGTNYFAIRYTSDNLFMLIIDDIAFIEAGEPRVLDLKGYNVYRNGEKLNESPVKERTHTVAKQDDKDSYFVTAVYSQGESLASAKVTLGAAGITGIEADAEVEAEFFTVQGVKVDGNSLPAGIYLRRAGNKVEKVVVR